MIVLRDAGEIERIRAAGSILARTLEKLRRIIAPGITTGELDRYALQEITRSGATPAFKGYRGYPANICTSINEEVVHGIPSERALRRGDLVSIDVGVQFQGYCADAAITVGVEPMSDIAKRLMEVTERSLYLGIDEARIGKRLFDISHTIQSYVEKNGFNVVRALVGHGIGTRIHEEPEIPNYGKANRGPRLAAGMIFAIEPMVNAGTYDVDFLDDGWTVVTKDRALSAHFEHTVAVTEKGPVILTKL